ncbi:hypothetical protein YP516_0285 [Yersinia pestis Nepal516]|nr:hypothetical protein YP516_0285 [Yersinia pestis Nepal516]
MMLSYLMYLSWDAPSEDAPSLATKEGNYAISGVCSMAIVLAYEYVKSH